MSVKVSRSGTVRAFALGLCVVLAAGVARAEAVKVEGTLTPKEDIRLEFKDGTGHLFTMVHRQGKLDGTGQFAKAAVEEYGVHDIVPGFSGSPSGYLVITKSEKDIAYLKWSTQTAFIKGADGKVGVVNNGTWTYISGLGTYAGLKGSGKIKITFGKDNERIFSLEGNLSK